MKRRACGCLSVAHVDKARHLAWHALVGDHDGSVDALRERMVERAQERRDSVLAAVESRTPVDARRVVFEAIRSVLDRQGQVSSSDIKPLLPAGIKPQQIGALWNAAVRSMGLVEVERRPDRYGHRLPVWTRRDAA